MSTWKLFERWKCKYKKLEYLGGNIEDSPVYAYVSGQWPI